MIALHNAFDGVQRRDALEDPAPGGSVPGGGPTVIAVIFPDPVDRVMAAGYCFGRVFQFDPDSRRKVLLRTGAVLTLLSW